MAARSRGKANNDFLTGEFQLWIACGVLGYSCLVLLLALESMAVAELALQFQQLNRYAIIGLVLLGTVGLFFKVVVSGWKTSYLLPLAALLMLLPGIQPSEGCCSELIAYIARHPSATTPVLSVVLWHLFPMIGCGLLIADEVGNRQLLQRFEKKKK